MSKIEGLLKNEKVEWKKLGEVALISKGKQFNKRDMFPEGKYPVINGGILPSGYIDLFNTSENTITVSQGGASAGFVNFIEVKFWLGAHAFSIIPSNDIIIKYDYEYSCFNRLLFHILKMNQTNLQDSKEGAGIPSVSKDKFSKIEIPLTSKRTQEKIVKTLDKFTNYATELQTELQCRTKQYEYYRDMLLSESYLNKISEKIDGLEKRGYSVRFTTLGEVGVFTRGNGLQKNDFITKGKPVIHYGQIYTKYGFETNKTISFVSDDIFLKLRKAKYKDILIATTSENIEDVGKSVVWLGNEEIGFSGDMYSYRTTENAKYIAYYFQTAEFQKQKEKKVTGTKLIRIHGDDMERISISLPPIEIQNKVVQILDKFQKLLFDTQGLLPQEIEQRQKQYEYYREKLLTFDTVCGSKQASKQASKIISNSYFVLLKEAANVVEVKLHNLEFKNFEEICECYDGTHQTPKYTNSGVPFVSVQDIKNIYGTNKFISVEDFKKYKIKPQRNDLFMTRIGDIGTCALVENDNDLAYYVTLTLIRPNQNIVLSKFLKYMIESNHGKSELYKRILHMANPIKINLGEISKLRFLIPSLPVQKYIVSILDKFDALINDISQGLPKEIELRRKQYEYYREKLLDFKRSNL